MKHTQAVAHSSDHVPVTAAYHCKVVIVGETSRPRVAVQRQTDDKQEGMYTLMLHELFSKFLRAAEGGRDLVICTACQTRSSARNKPKRFLGCQCATCRSLCTHTICRTVTLLRKRCAGRTESGLGIEIPPSFSVLPLPATRANQEAANTF